MKKYFFIFLSFVCLSAANAQHVLPVPVVYQEQDQWCWSGCSKCIFDYYADTVVDQCEIADYARTVATWHSYGATNCCTNPALGCNYWNYMSGYAGSIEDILGHFNGIANHLDGALTLAEMDTQAAHYHPMVFHWAWTGGGGHFVVGNGVDAAGNIHYMNPWVGEGAHIATHSWMLSGGGKVYSWTTVLDNCPVPLMAGTVTGTSTVAVGGHVTLSKTVAGGTWSVTNAKATVSSAGVVTGVAPGLDTVIYTVMTTCGPAATKKVMTITSSTTSINAPANSATAELVVFPDPNNGSFTFDLHSLTQEPVNIVITDLVGARVLQTTALTNQPTPISLDKPAGIYLLSATTSGGAYNARIVVDK